MMKKRVLIIDSYNLFIRNYVICPDLCSSGLPCGGTKGFLKSLQKTCREMSPSQIFIVWDGAGGSKRRRKLNSNYKEGRGPVKLNRNIHNLTEEEEKINKDNQLLKLIDYLNDMPVVQFLFDGIEADDVIARLCKSQALKGNIKFILSSDKDFIQLCDNETVLHRPVQKETLNEKRIVQEYGIHPTNFALARAVVGDPSDNLRGVPGVGFKTVKSRLAFLAESKTYTIDDLLTFCRENQEKAKAYKDILTCENEIRLNYKMMQLYLPSLSPAVSKTISDTVKNFIPIFNQTAVTLKMASDGFDNISWENLFQNFRRVVAEFKQTEG